MKNIFFFLVAFVFTLGSCSEFLDTKPTDFLSPVTYFETEDQLEFALTGVYDPLGKQATYARNYITLMGLEADEGAYNPSTTPIMPVLYNFSAGDVTIEAFWGQLYTGIYRANLLLENVDKNEEIEASFRDRILGEALFLRGYYYFLLVQHFGGVPLILESTKSAAGNDIPRASVQEVYEQVISDMEAAEMLVLPIRELGFGGRVNRSAVRGILARVCLYMAGYPVRDESKYERAKYWADKVINDTEAAHVLNPDFTEVFINYAQDKYDVGESLFEVEFWGNSATAENKTGQVGSWIGIQISAAAAEANPQLGTAYGYINSTAKLYQSYEENDKRRDWSISNFTYTNTGTKEPITSTTPSSLYARKAAKYRREYELVTPKSNQNTPINWPVLRFSDVLLMYVEAENELNGPPELGSPALNYINQIRARAGASIFDATNLITDKNEFRNFIIDERSRELCFEGLRKPDLIRWGIFMFTMKDMETRMATDVPNSRLLLAFQNVQERNLLFPIPSREMTLNRVLEQNPNW